MTINRWKTFTKSQQLLMVGSEIMRAKAWQGVDEGLFQGALERTFPLVDLCLEDKKWQDQQLSLLTLRDELGKFYVGQRKDSVELLYHTL